MERRIPRIVFCDLDDTFLSYEKELIERNMAVLDELARRSIPFVPSTGRGLNAVLFLERLSSHPAVRYAIVSSGAVVYDLRRREPIHMRIMGKERALELYRRVRDLDVTFDIFCDGRTLAERWRRERLKTFGIEAPMLAHMLRSRTPSDLPVEQILEEAQVVERVGIYNRMDEAGMAQGALARAAAVAVGGLRYTSAHPAGIEVIDEKCSKGEALEWLCAHLGIDVADSVAFGDSSNDAEMIRAAGTGVAMANASEQLKQAADMIAPANDEAGVACVLEAMLAGESA